MDKNIENILNKYWARQTLDNAWLQANGYKIKIPNAQYSIFGKCLIITKKDGKRIELPYSDLEKFLNRKLKLPEEDEKEIREWYNIFMPIRFTFELEKLEKKYKKAEEKKNVRKITDLLFKRDDLIKELNNVEEFNKNYLAYLFQEKGERLQRLCEHYYGEIGRFIF